MYRRTVPLVIVFAAALIGGCGSNEHPVSQERASRAHVVEISMHDMKFLPRRTRVRVGQTVRWVNHDSYAHTVVAVSGANFSSAAVPAGDTYTFTPRRAGTVNYVCTIHQGQAGTLIVEP